MFPLQAANGYIVVVQEGFWEVLKIDNYISAIVGRFID